MLSSSSAGAIVAHQALPSETLSTANVPPVQPKLPSWCRGLSNAPQAAAGVPRRLHGIALDKILCEGSPQDVQRAIGNAQQRAEWSQAPLVAYVPQVLTHRDDPQALACLLQAGRDLRIPPEELMAHAIQADNPALIVGLARACPAAMGRAFWTWIAAHQADTGRALLEQHPEQAIHVDYDSCLAMYLPNSVLAADMTLRENRKILHDRTIEAMQRVPRYAYHVAELLSEQHGCEHAWSWAMMHAPLPSIGFLCKPALRFASEESLLHAIAMRPERVNSTVIRGAIDRGSLKVLEAACRANPRVLQERNTLNLVLACFKPGFPEDPETANIIKRYVGMALQRLERTAPCFRKLSAPEEPVLRRVRASPRPPAHRAPDTVNAHNHGAHS